MKRSFLNKAKGYIGILLILLSLGLLVYWELYGREIILYTDIVVLNQDVLPNTVITKDMLSIVKEDESSLIDKVILAPDTIIGLETKHFIPKNTQLHPEYFDLPKLVLDENEYIFSIPKDWIIAFPGSLRRKDVIYFYEIKNYELNNLTSNTLSSNIDMEEIETLETFDNEKITIGKVSPEKYLISSVVAYVKDSANREVVTVGDNDRYDASSNIDRIEIVATVDMINKLESSYEQGNKFIILYR